MSHTKEPWRVIEDGESGYCIHGPEKVIFGVCYVEISRDDDEAQIERRRSDARRIVACVNACTGISTENLEDNIPVKELAKRYNEVLKQRDELLAALQTFVDEHEECTDAADWMAFMCSTEALHVAEEAIAAVEQQGGAA